MARKLLCMIGSLSATAAFVSINKPNYKQRINTEEEQREKNINNAIENARKLLYRLKDEVGAPGIVVGVSLDGGVVWQEGIGYADLENQVPVSEDTVMRIASISKSLTASVVGRLWQEGKLDIDQPIQKYVPTFPEKTYGDEKAVITTRHLMCHLSGIRHYFKKKKDDSVGNGDGQLEEFYSKERYDNIEKALSIFKNDDLLHAPGTKFLYTTYGWTVVSAVMEGATGKTYPQLMRAFLRKMGMRRTYLDEPEPIIYGRSKCYTKSKNGRIVNAPYVDNSCKWAGGGFLSTVGDLLKFANGMLFAFQSDGDIDVSKKVQVLTTKNNDEIKEMKSVEQKNSSLECIEEEVQEIIKVTKDGKGEAITSIETEESNVMPESSKFVSIMKGIGYGVSNVWGLATSMLKKENVENKETEEKSAESDSIISSGVRSFMKGVNYSGSYVWSVTSSMFGKYNDESRVEKKETSLDSQSMASKTISGIYSVGSSIWKRIPYIGDQDENSAKKNESPENKEDEASYIELIKNWFRPKALDIPHKTESKISDPEGMLLPWRKQEEDERKSIWFDIILPNGVAVVLPQSNSECVSKDEGIKMFGNVQYSTGCNFNCLNINKKPYISSSTIASLWTRVEGTRFSDWGPHVEGGYGLGFGVAPAVDSAGGVPDGGQPYIVGHTGGAVGASSAMVIIPRKCYIEKPPKGVVVVIMTNLQSVSLNPIAIEIAKTFSDAVKVS